MPQSNSAACLHGGLIRGDEAFFAVGGGIDLDPEFIYEKSEPAKSA